MKDIEVSIKGLRAVNNADIALNGITVISGVNSSGKSTISRLLYYTFKYANEFDKHFVDNGADVTGKLFSHMKYSSKRSDFLRF